MKSPKQKIILNFASKNSNQITKKDAVELIGHCYFLNAQKYVGEVLSRMVKQQLLKRIKNGVFEIETNRKQTIENIIDPNQIPLF